MTNKKKPDQVVFNTETNRYDAALKPYGTDLGAPAIITTDSIAWKNRNINKVNNHLSAKFKALKKEYEGMLEQFNFNNLIYNSDFNFEPIVGKIYHMYKRENESTFLSIISPDECNFNHVESFYLDADGIWYKSE